MQSHYPSGTNAHMHPAMSKPPALALLASDMPRAQEAAEILRMRTWLEETLSKHSNKPIDEVRKDIDRDKILTAPEALEYGLIDQVLTSRKSISA